MRHDTPRSWSAGCGCGCGCAGLRALGMRCDLLVNPHSHSISLLPCFPFPPCSFFVVQMIRGSLYAFRSPCMDKRIKVKVSLSNIDELVARELPAFRIGQIISEGPEHGRLGRGQRASTGLNAALGVTSASAGADSDDETGFASSRKSRARHKYMHRAYVRGDPYRSVGGGRGDKGESGQRRQHCSRAPAHTCATMPLLTPTAPRRCHRICVCSHRQFAPGVFQPHHKR
jgi:hypothetical protein